LNQNQSKSVRHQQHAEKETQRKKHIFTPPTIIIIIILNHHYVIVDNTIIDSMSIQKKDLEELKLSVARPSRLESRRDATLAELKQFQADLNKKIPSQDQESPATEPPYVEKPSSSSSSRDETTADLKNFQTKMAGKIDKDKPKKTTLSSLEQQDEPQQESQTTPPQLKIMSFSASPEVTKQVLPTKRRVTELERQNEEMTRNDLTASLLQFQTQMRGHLQNIKAPPSSPGVQEANHKPPRFEKHKSTRHNSLELKSPLRPKRGSLDLKSPLASLDLKPALNEQQQQQEQNFRKWFESKMDARTGVDDFERYVLEEDDVEEDDDIVLEVSFPGNKSEDDPLPAIGLGQQETTAATTTDSVKEAAPPENHNPWKKTGQEETLLPLPSKDRAAQIERQNEHLSRDEIKASLLQFQSQMNHPVAEEPQESAEVTPSNASVKKESPQRQNEQMSRNELTASLLQFQSKIGKIQPSPPRAKENVGQDTPNEASNKPNVATNERQSQVQPQMQDLERRTKVFQDRVKLLEERETTPRNEMVSSLKQFQLDIQGRIDHRPAKKSGLDCHQIVRTAC
jgi:hypothetical protein